MTGSLPAKTPPNALRDFNSVSNKIFAKQIIDILVAGGQPGQLSEHDAVRRIRNCSDLRNQLKSVDDGSSGDVVLVLLQDYSWGRLRLTGAAFQILVSSMHISLRFNDIVTAFGVKSNDAERRVYDLRACTYIESCSEFRHEICYNIIYIDKHGRDLKDPWSLRQLGVYNQTTEAPTDNLWVLVDLASNAEVNLRDFIRWRSGECRFLPHIKLLQHLSTNWASYIEHLESRLATFDHKARYTSTSDMTDTTYVVDYSDLQKLQMLENKIQQSLTAIESGLEIGRGCAHYYAVHAYLDGSKGKNPEFLNLLHVYQKNMECYCLSLKRLQAHLTSTLNLLSSVLNCRNNHLLLNSGLASHDALRLLVDVSNQSQQQQEKLTKILAHGEADSALLKALSIVATVCLPASLIATVFSSNLIQTSKVSDQPSDTHLVVSAQFWVYIVISLPLMAVTLTWIVYINKKSQAKLRTR